MNNLTYLDRLISESKLIAAHSTGYIAQNFQPDNSFMVAGGGKDTIQCLAKLVATDGPTILYFHDPALTDTAVIAKTATSFAASEINFIVAEYCASGAEHSCSYSELVKRASAIIAPVQEWLETQLSTASLFLMGQSVGGVIAVTAATGNAKLVKGLLLDSLICDTSSFLTAVSGRQAAIDETNGFGCLDMLADYTSPTLFYHGAKDHLVSTRDAEKLQSYSGARTKQFFIIPGAERNNLEAVGGTLYFDTIKKFTDTVCGTNTWREKRRKYKAGQK